MAWVGALDGGGTKTAGAVADRAGRVRRLADGAGSNPQDGPGWDGVLRGAFAAMGGVAGVVVGVPGYGEVPDVDRAVRAFLGAEAPGPWEAMNDVALARLAAFGGGQGVLLLAGTGALAWALGPGGEARADGWGDVVGDEGSAFWIGQEALRAAARELDGREDGDFAGALSAALGVSGAFAPLVWLIGRPGNPRAHVAGVARVVDAIAERGGEGAGRARAILGRAGGCLADAALAAAARAGLGAGFPWVPGGSVFRSRFVRGAVEARLGAPGAARLSTLAGGLMRAAALAGWEVDEAWAARVEAGLR